MKVILFLFFSLILFHSSASDSLKYIKVHFLYGSKPKKEFKEIESNWFGGIHGGHVEIEINDSVIGFVPQGSFHVFGNKTIHHSGFYKFSVKDWMRDKKKKKLTSIIIPVTHEQYQKILATHEKYRNETPYDYAFFGYRCAAATYDILSQAGLSKSLNRDKNVTKFFYPKLLRTHLAKIAKEKNYVIVAKDGRKTRKWERDKKFVERIIHQKKLSYYWNSFLKIFTADIKTGTSDSLP